MINAIGHGGNDCLVDYHSDNPGGESLNECIDNNANSFKDIASGMETTHFERMEKKIDEIEDEELRTKAEQLASSMNQAVSELTYDARIATYNGIDFASVTGLQQHADIKEIAEKASAFGQNKEDTTISGPFLSIIQGLQNEILSIARYILYIAILFMGVRCIWNGVEGKTQFKETLPYILLAIIFTFAADKMVGLAQAVFDPDQFKYDYATRGNEIFGSVALIVAMLSFGGIIFTGVKFMFASVDGKADAKKHLFPILIGCLLVFAAGTIVSITLSIVEGLPDSTVIKIPSVDSSKVIKYDTDYKLR